MIYITAGMLTSMAVLGGICTCTDFRNGMILNRHLLMGAVVSLLFHTALLICGASPYYPTWLINMCIADVLAFFLYLGHFWAAGDAKMFFVFYSLVPPPVLDADVFSYWILPFIYIFVLALLWILIDTSFRMIRREPRKIKHYDWKEILKGSCAIILETTGLYCLLRLVASELINDQEMLVTLLLMVYAYLCGAVNLMKKWYIFLLHGAVILLSWFLGRWTFTIPNGRSLILIALMIGLKYFASQYNYRLTAVSDVKQGMIPSAEAVFAFQTSRVRPLPTDPSEELSAKLSAEEAEAIHRWGKSVQGKQFIWIVRKTPFAVMISLGFVLWMIMRVWR